MAAFHPLRTLELFGMIRRVKIVTRVCEGVGACLVVFIAVFSNYIDSARPSHALGRFIIPTENHGQQVYISSTDRAVLTGAWIAFFVMIVVCIGLEGTLRSRR